MSVASMSQVGYARRTDNELEQPTSAFLVNKAAHGDDSMPNDVLTSALGSIATYIPSELVVLYTGIIAAISASNSPSHRGQCVAFWLVFGLTPVTVWVLYATRVKTGGKKLPLDPRIWPWLEMIASLIAFFIWAAALPKSPVQLDWSFYDTAVATVIVLVGTFAIGLVTPLFSHSIQMGNAPPSDDSKPKIIQDMGKLRLPARLTFAVGLSVSIRKSRGAGG